jgi:hypothetical protein
MSRKAIKRRADVGEAVNLLADYSSTSAPDLGNLDSETLRARDMDRTRLLLAYTPRNNQDIAAQVRDSVVDLILRVPYVSWYSDQAMLKVGFRYAIYCVKTLGHWNPTEHLLQPRIERWAQVRDESPNTRATELATLARLRRGKRVEAKFSRNIATPPYSRDEWARLDDICQSGINQDATTLIHLAGHLGLRAMEISQATGNWIHTVDDKVWLVVPSGDGTFRAVPAYDDTAGWLLTKVDAAEKYLLRPRRKWRHSVITAVVDSISKNHPQLIGFQVLRARHRFILQLLHDDLSLRVIHEVAGLTPGSSLPTDLLPYLPEPSMHHVYQSVLAARRKRQGF